MDTLGIFITSDHYPDYLWALARAARNKGLRVRIHFSGSGVRLVSEAAINRLPQWAQITVCRESAAMFQVDRLLQAHQPQWLVPSGRMARLIQECDRHLFI